MLYRALFGLLSGIAVFLVCSFFQPACSCVDPGSGLHAFQILGSTLAGMIFLIQKRILSTVHRLFRLEWVESGGHS